MGAVGGGVIGGGFGGVNHLANPKQSAATDPAQSGIGQPPPGAPQPPSPGTSSVTPITPADPATPTGPISRALGTIAAPTTTIPTQPGIDTPPAADPAQVSQRLGNPIIQQTGPGSPDNRPTPAGPTARPTFDTTAPIGDKVNLTYIIADYGPEVARELSVARKGGTPISIDDAVAAVERRKQQGQPTTRQLAETHAETQEFDKGIPLNRTSYQEINGIGYSEYTNPQTGIVDVYLSAFGDNDFVGYMRVYENGKPTNRFTSKLERQTSKKGVTKEMLSNIASMLPEGHEYTENDTISTDGLRHFQNQLRNGYEIVLDQSGKPKTSAAILSGASRNNDLGIGQTGDFTNLEVKTDADFTRASQVVAKLIAPFGLDTSAIRRVGNNIEVQMPVLRRSVKNTQQENKQTPRQEVSQEPKKEMTTAESITKGMSEIAAGMDLGSRDQMAEYIKAGKIDRLTFRRPDSIAAARANPSYNLKDNSDGSVTVVGINNSNNEWIGVAPLREPVDINGAVGRNESQPLGVDQQQPQQLADESPIPTTVQIIDLKAEHGRKVGNAVAQARANKESISLPEAYRRAGVEIPTNNTPNASVASAPQGVPSSQITPEHQALSSIRNPKYTTQPTEEQRPIFRELAKKGFAASEDGLTYSITKKGVRQLKRLGGAVVAGSNEQTNTQTNTGGNSLAVNTGAASVADKTGQIDGQTGGPINDNLQSNTAEMATADNQQTGKGISGAAGGDIGKRGSGESGQTQTDEVGSGGGNGGRAGILQQYDTSGNGADRRGSKQGVAGDSGIPEKVGKPGEQSIEVDGGPTQIQKPADTDGRKPLREPEPNSVREPGRESLGESGAQFQLKNQPVNRPAVIDNPDSVAHGQKANLAPSEAQKEKGNYLKSHVNLDGLEVTIENPAGSTRSGTDKTGKTWSVKMAHDYGYIKGSVGYDKDHVDVFMVPGYQGGGETAYIVNQHNKDGKFDEHKVVFGAKSEADAMSIYNANYAKGWTGGKSVAAMPMAEFKEWVKSEGPKKGAVKQSTKEQPNGNSIYPDTKQSGQAETGKVGEEAKARNLNADLSAGAKEAKPGPKAAEKPGEVTFTVKSLQTGKEEEFTVKENPVAESAPANSTQPESAPSQIAAKVREYLARGERFFSRRLFAWADEAYGGTQAEGKYTPKDAYDALELGINQYLADGFTFKSTNPAEQIKELEGLLFMVPTQTKRTKEQDDFQQYSTPPTLAFVAGWVANLKKNDSFLEPSAGIGGLAVFAKIAGAKSVAVNELSSRRRDILKEMGFDQVYGENAEQLNNVMPDSVKPTVIVMNPPFSSTGGRLSRNKTKYGAGHIEQALKRLEPGGRLVAIVGEGMAADKTTFRTWWKEIEKEYTVRANVGMNGEGFRKYGTTFDNQILVIDKTGPTRDTIVTGKVDTYTDLIPLLQGVRDARTATAQQSTDQQAGKEKAPGSEAGTKPVETVLPTTPAVGNGQRGIANGTGDRRQDRPDVKLEAGNLDERGNEPQSGGRGADIDKGQVAVSEGSGVEAAGPDRESTPDTDKLETSRKEKQQSSGDSIFEGYQPTVSIRGAKPHPADLVESTAMAAVKLPDITYRPRIPVSAVKAGKLSDVQLEAITAAGQAHQDTLPNGEQRGFFIGDGTGVGKGREIAGILWDNWNQGRKKSIWVSKDRTLAKDAKRDMSGIGWDDKLLIEQGSVKAGESLPKRDGVLYTAYSTLASAAKIGQLSRLQSIIDWAGPNFDGVIAFDESHKMGNAISIKEGRYTKKPSQMALAALDLQKALPKAKVVYVSATGATEVSNLAYAERLGLWGADTAFANASAFISRVSQGGIAAMEVVARDMKAMGSYLARKLAYNGKNAAYQVKYRRLEHALSGQQRDIYDELAGAWQTVLANIDDALAITEADSNGRSHALSAFWGSHQRFFNQVLTAMQMPSVITSIKQDVKDGKAVVLQITNTNEASTNRALANTENLEDVDITPRDQLMQMIENSFPVQQYEQYEDDEGNIRTRPVVDSNGNPVVNREAVAKRESLLNKLGSIRVPDAPLDQILNVFGVGAVAEVTGRSKRVVTVDDGTGPKKIRQGWSKTKGVADAAQFMADKKQILIFSEAGGTGASYHADLAAINQRQRSHYILQAGWRADSAVQGLGRSHRSNQAVAPEYVLVTTDLKGHKRFISSIARKLSQLGALTEGERGASSQGLFSERDNLESEYAADAVEQLIHRVHRGQIPGMDITMLSRELGLPNLVDEHGQLNATQVPTVPRFLNRILSMKIEMQDKVFDLFSTLMDANVSRAEENGTLDTGLETLKAKGIRIVDSQPVYTDKRSGAVTEYVQLDVDYPVDKLAYDPRHKVVVNNQSGKPWQLVSEKSTTTESGDIVDVFVLRNGRGNHRNVLKSDFGEKFTTIASNKEARGAWDKALKELPETVTQREHLITGALLPIWDKLKGHPRIVRVQAGKETMLGRIIPGENISEVMALLDVEGKAVEMSPEQVQGSVLENGQTITLDNGWKIRAKRVAGEKRMEVEGVGYGDYRVLENYGAFTERINYVTRNFIPVGEDGNSVIEKILANRKILTVVGSQGGATLYSKTNQPSPSTSTFMAQVQSELKAFLGAGYDNLVQRGKLEIARSAEELPGPMRNAFLKMVAWHGTRNDVDKFSTEKIGTGEGAQAYGYGLYFAGSREVAEWYKKILNNYDKLNALTYEEDRYLPEFITVEIMKYGEYSASKYLDTYKKYLLDTDSHSISIKPERVKIVSILEKLIKSGDYSFSKKEGKLYQVELAPAEDEYLLWDKPLSEQSERVKAAVKTGADKFKEITDRANALEDTDETVQKYRDLMDERKKYAGFAAINRKPKGYDGNSIYHAVSDGDRSGEAGRIASQTLHSLGIRGIKYLDGSSRSSGDGNYNYVIFNDSDIEIKAVFSKKGKVVGSYFPYQKKIVLFSDAMAPGDAKHVFTHEGGHALLFEDKIFRARKTRILKNFARLARTSQAVKDAFAKVPKDTATGLRGEEAIMYFIQEPKNHNHSIFRRVISAVRAALYRMGLMQDMKLSESDLVALFTQGVKAWAKREVDQDLTKGRGVNDILNEFGVGQFAQSAKMPVKRAARKIQGIEAFKKWFEGSVVTENGKVGGEPLVVYHGTTENFDAFQTGNSGAYFTNKPEVSNGYAGGEGKYFTKSAGVEYRGRNLASAKAFRKRAMELEGHDGIIIKDRGQVIAFSPNQLKSASDNTGAFSRDNDDVRYSVSSNPTAPLSTESLEEAAKTLGSSTYIKNSKVDSTWLDRLLSTPEHYFKKFAAAGRVLQAALLRRDIRFENEQKILGGFVSFVQQLRKENKDAYTEANDYLLETDQAADGFRIRSTDNDSWQVIAPKWAAKGNSTELGEFTDEAEAIRTMIEEESLALSIKGYSREAIEAVKQAREMTNRGFDVMAADMRKIIAEAKENGLPDPFIGDGKLDEAGRYGVYAAGKKKPIALFASEKEANEMLDRAAQMISYVVTSKSRGEKTFMNELKANRWAKAHSGTVNGVKTFQNLTVKKRTDADLRPLTVKQALAQMGDLRGIFFPRIRESGEYVMIAKKEGENPIRKHFDIPTFDDKKPTLQKYLGMVTPMGREINRLKAKGFTVTFEKDKSPAEDVFDATNLITSLDAILQSSLTTIDQNNETEVRAGQHINQILTMQVADIFKSRGYLSSRLKRLAGDVVWEGYEEDMGKALTQYGKNVAAGTAKRDTARAMVLAFSGRDYSWADYKAEVDKPDWKEYQEIIEKRRIDEKLQKNLFRDVRSFMIDILRNDEQADRIMGTLKGLAVIKYLGFRVSSAAVNMTNMVQGVPGTIAGYTGESVGKSLRRVTGAAVAYGKYRSGKGDLSESDRNLFQFISAKGWDEAQFNHEAARELRSKLGDTWNKYIVGWGMLMFGAVEKANRAMTLFAAYKAVKAKEATAEESVIWGKAKEISDNAHGVYGKETLPAWARGKFNPLRLTYTFQKFSHNYMINALDIGFNKKEYGAAAYLLLSPAVLAGSGASLLGPLAFALVGAVPGGGDDPEEEFYAWAEEMFGGGSFARHGLFGVAGINIKGSLAMHLPMPTDIAKATVTDALGPVGGIFSDMVKGVKHLFKGELAKGVEGLLPTAFGNVSKALRESSEGITTSNYGQVFYGDEPLKADATDAFIRFLSFNPSRLSGIREMQWNEKEVAQKYQEKKSEIYSQIKRSRLKGEGITPEIMKTVKDYNDKVAGSGRRDISPITMRGIVTMLKRNSRPGKVERGRMVAAE